MGIFANRSVREDRLSAKTIGSAAMKTAMARLAALVILAALCLTAALAEEAPAEDRSWAFVGDWAGEEIAATFGYDDEGENLRCRLMRDEGDAIGVWEFDACWYDVDEDALLCLSCVRYREDVDLDRMETVQTDWSLDDMAMARFIISGDGEAIAGRDIPGIDDVIVLKRYVDPFEED